MLGRLIAGGHVSSSRVTFIGGAMAGVVQGLAEVAELIGNRRSSPSLPPVVWAWALILSESPTVITCGPGSTSSFSWPERGRR